MRARVWVVALVSVLISATAMAETFETGSLIIPMDTDYQDEGMLKAFGLVYALLQEDVPIYWVIEPGKSRGDADFTADAVDFADDTQVVTAHPYRGGPFVVRAADAERAGPVITAWQASHITTVHEATASFEGTIAKTLVVAPTIAMFADGNQDIARGYMEAAGIPDSTGDIAWPDSSPDMLDVAEVSGPTETNHSDGALFDEDGAPVYCQLMSMHWKIDDGVDNPEVVAEVRAFLQHPVHFFAECQAVNAFENNVNGRFLTAHGFIIDNLGGGDPLDFLNADSPFAQIDGPFELVGGSETAYTPCAEEACETAGDYKTPGVVMITGQGTGEAVQDVWMTGFIDGSCPPDRPFCEVGGRSIGKVSYLGGHRYETDLPMSENPKSAGTRLFLQSLFEAPCATPEGQPEITLTKSAPAFTSDGTVVFEIAFANTGPGVALSATLTDDLPEGATFVEASDGGVESEGVVTWSLGNLGPGESGSVTLTVTLADLGDSVDNIATLDYLVGTSTRSVSSEVASVTYDTDTDDDGVGDSIDICPDDPNPEQDLDVDPASCGACGNVCEIPGGTAGCAAGSCTVASCDAGRQDTDGDPSNGCEDTGGDVGDTSTTDDTSVTTDTSTSDDTSTAGDATGVDTTGSVTEGDTPGAEGSEESCGCALLASNQRSPSGPTWLLVGLLAGFAWRRGRREAR